MCGLLLYYKHTARAGPFPRSRAATLTEVALDSTLLADRLLDLLSDRQAEELARIDIRRAASFADYFVIASVGSVRQMNALIETLEKEMRAAGVPLEAQEGLPDSGWVLLDFGSVIVHLFSHEQRAYYDLEGLWSRSAPLVRFGT
jgi:ribosome-associated protein